MTKTKKKRTVFDLSDWPNTCTEVRDSTLVVWKRRDDGWWYTKQHALRQQFGAWTATEIEIERGPIVAGWSR